MRATTQVCVRLGVPPVLHPAQWEKGGGMKTPKIIVSLEIIVSLAAVATGAALAISGSPAVGSPHMKAATVPRSPSRSS
jgi:hypothetical protein